jgi:hypothetical protein
MSELNFLSGCPVTGNHIKNDLNFISGKELLDGTPFPFSDGFGLGPFGFNVI